MLVFVNHFAVHQDLGVFQAADHVPVDDALVPGAGLGVTRTQRHVEGAAQLLVEQDVVREAVDVIVGADGKFAHETGTGIRAEHLEQEGLVLGGGGFGNLAVAEGQLDAFDHDAAGDGGVGIAHPAVDRIFDRAGEYFAVRHVVRAKGIHEGAALDRERQVHIRAAQHDLVVTLKGGDHRPLIYFNGFPVGQRVGFLGVAGLEYEIFKILEAHLGFHGIALGGIERADPLEGPFGAAPHLGFEDGRDGGLAALLFGRVDSRKAARVGCRGDLDAALELVIGQLAEGGDEIELLIVGVLEEDLLLRGQVEQQMGVPAALQDARIQGADQRSGCRGGFDGHPVSGLDAGGVIHQDGCQFFNSYICQGFSPQYLVIGERIEIISPLYSFFLSLRASVLRAWQHLSPCGISSLKTRLLQSLCSFAMTYRTLLPALRSGLFVAGFGQLFEHERVQARGGCQHRERTGDVVRPAVDIGDDRTGLFGDQPTGGHVPGGQGDLPVAVEAPACHVHQVEGSRAQAAHTLGHLGEARKVVKVVVGGVPGVVGEACHQQTVHEFRDGRDAQGRTVQPGTAAALGRETLVAHRVIDHAQLGEAFVRIGDGYAEDRDVVGVVDRAIERVDEPHMVFQAVRFPGFFGQDGVPGMACADLVQDECFGLVVDLGHQVDDAFVVDLVLVGIAAAQDHTSLAGQGFNIFQVWGHGCFYFFPNSSSFL